MSSPSLHRLRIALLTLLSVMCLASCTSTHSPASSTNSKKQDSGDSESKKDEKQNKEEVLTGDAAKYPADFPFAQYPNSKVTLIMTKPEQSTVSVNLETADAPTKVMAYYKEWFKSNNWKIDQQSSTTGLAAVSAQNGNKQTSIMSMPGATSSGQSSIQITVSNGK